MKKYLTILAIALFSSTGSAQNEPKVTPIADYQSHTELNLYECKLSVELAILQSQVGKKQDEQYDYNKCIERVKVSSKTYLVKALKTVHKAKATDALKSYQVAFITALVGIAPGDAETKWSYEARQQSLKDKLTEAWARFEIEQ